MKKLLLIALLASSAATPAIAKDLSDSWDSLERFQFRARTIGVIPEDAGHTTIGGTPDPDTAVVPEVDVTYFITENIAAELIAATSPHDVFLKNSTLGTLDLGDVWVLPPTITLQYHFQPDEKISPYIGAGVNYTLPYAEDAAGGAVTDLEVDGSFGYALQAGVDYWVSENVGFNLDVKKIFVDLDASVNNNAITGEVELDPWVVGAGLSFRF